MNHLLGKINRFLWKLSIGIPHAKSILLIVNSYVWRGNEHALLRFAPISLYIKNLLLKITIVTAISFATVHLGQCEGWLKSGDLKLLSISGTLFPSILGFGIGAYALLFTFPAGFFENLESQRANRKAKVGAYGLNAITAFPLLAMAIITLASVLLDTTTISTKAANVAGLSFILYGLSSTIELISILFVSARKVIRNSPIQENPKPETPETPQDKSEVDSNKI